MKSIYNRGIFHTNTSPELYPDNQKLFPSKYIKEKYPLLNEVVPKYSILYKVKYKPDFTIKEYLKTKMNSSEVININKPNYISNNQNYDENTNNTLLNELEENEPQNQKYNNINCRIIENNFYDNKILYDVSPIRDIENTPNNNINISKKILIERKNLNNKEFSNINSYLNSLSNSGERQNPLLKNNTIERKNPLLKNITRKRKNPLIKNSHTIDDNYNYLKTEKVRKKIIKLENEYSNNFLKTSKIRNIESNFNNPIELNLEQSNEKNKDQNLYLNFMKNNNYSERNRKFFFNKNNTFNNPKIKSPSKNFINIKNKEYIEDFNDSFKNKRKRYHHYFSPVQKTRKILEKNSNTYYSNIDYININRNLNTKLKNYRIKLCVEFCRHFNQFFKMLLKKYFFYFIQKLDNGNDNNNDNENINYTYFYNKRNKFNNYKNMKSPGTIKDIYKNNTVNDYETLYKKISKRTIYSNKTSTINNKNSNSNSLNRMYNYTNNFNSGNNYTISKNNTLNNDTLSNSPNNKYNIQSVPRSKKININNNNNNSNDYINALSARRNHNNKLIESNSFSPSFRIGNRTIINRDISFRNEGISKENELFRDTKELNKKFWQIQTRKIRSKNKDGSKDKNYEKEQIKKNNMTLNTSEIKHEFDEIRKYINSVKKDKERKSSRKNIKNKTINTKKYDNKTLNNMSHYRKKHLIKISNLENNDIIDNNINYEIYDYENDIKDYEKKKRYERNKKIDKIINKYKSLNNNNTKDSNKNRNNNNYNINLNSLNKIEQINSSLNSLSSIHYNKKNKLIYISKDAKNNHNKIKVPSIKSMKNTNKIFHGFQQHNIQNIYSPNKHIIYYSKANDNKHKKKEVFKKIKVFSMLIKNIVTKDKRIHITINYYFFKNKKSSVERYNFLEPSEKFSLNIICSRDNNYKKLNDQKLRLKLSEIKEEDHSNIRNSNILENFNKDKKISKKEFIKEEINSYYYENNKENKNIRKIPKNLIYNKKK